MKSNEYIINSVPLTTKFIIDDNKHFKIKQDNILTRPKSMNNPNNIQHLSKSFVSENLYKKNISKNKSELIK